MMETKKEFFQEVIVKCQKKFGGDFVYDKENEIIGLDNPSGVSIWLKQIKFEGAGVSYYTLDTDSLDPLNPVTRFIGEQYFFRGYKSYKG